MSKDDARRSAKPKKQKRAAEGAPTKRKDNRKKSGAVGGAIKMGRSLRTGGAYVVKASKRAYRDFNMFTQGGDPDKDARGGRRGAAPAQRMPISRNLAYVIFLLSIFLIMSVALMVLNNASVDVEKVTVSIVGLPKELEGYTILHISDMHARSFGTGQTSILRTINGLSYNMVVFTGDMVGASGDAQPFYDLLDGMTANRPTFFIAGDSDPAPMLDEPREITGTLEEMVLSDWVLGAQARGATYLDATTGVPVGQTTLWLSPVGDLSINIQDTLKTIEEVVEQETEGVLAGFDVDRQSLPLTDYRRKRIARLDEAVRAMKSEEVHLTLAHYPPSKQYIEVTQQLTEGEDEDHQYLPGTDLVMAGHYCGGAWKLPFVGALYVPNTTLDRHGWFPAQEDVEGLKLLGGTQLYTSSGLSVTDKIILPNFRLFNPPTVTQITLTAAITDTLIG